MTDKRDAPRVGIVGGGILGLTLALRLRQHGFDVTVFEGSPSAGGLATPPTIASYAWDGLYHPMLLSDAHLRGLLEELGIDDRIRWGLTRTGFHVGGKLHAVSSIRDLLQFPSLSLIDKARLGLTILRAAHVRDPASLETLSGADWLRRWGGRHTYAHLWLPLLKAELGANHTKPSAAFMVAMIARMYASRRTGGGGGAAREVCGYIHGGYPFLLDALCEHVVDLGVRIETNATVARAFDDRNSATILLKDSRVAVFDHLVVTTPAPVAARLCPQLTDAERARLEHVTYQGLVCMSLLLRRSLGEFYVSNIATPGIPFTAVIEMTALVPVSTFAGHTLVYLPRHVAQDDSYWSLSDSAIRNHFLDALGTLYPQLAARDVVASEIARVRYVLALPTRNYSHDVRPSLETSRPRIHLVNSAQIAYGTLNVNEIVALATTQAERLAPRIAPHDVRFHTPWPAVPASTAGSAP
ncbi:MAG: FAD-dependent oxidoreductase [Gemmatimonadaceae bacterium]